MENKDYSNISPIVQESLQSINETSESMMSLKFTTECFKSSEDIINLLVKGESKIKINSLNLIRTRKRR